MGISFPPIRDFVTNYIVNEIKPKNILDLGCGFGYYGKDIKAKNKKIYICGVEAFEPYINNSKSWVKNYNNLIVDDLKDHLGSNLLYDLVLIMDVIEHFEKTEALYIIERLKQFKTTIISTPLFNYVQGAANNNELEIHKCWFSEKELNDLGFKTFCKIKFPSRKGNIGAFIHDK